VGAFLEHLEVECGLSSNTLSAYQRDLKEFVAWVGAEGIEEASQIQPQLVRGHLAALHHRGLSVGSVARHLVAIRMLLRYLFVNGVVKRDIAALFDTPRTWQHLPSVVSAEEVGRLIEAPNEQEPLYLRDRAILEMLYGTGLRASELVSLRSGDVNLQIGYVRCIGKGRRERIVPLGRCAVEAVGKYVASLRSKLVNTTKGEELFVSRTGRPLDRHNLWRLVGRYARRAGLGTRVTPHVLRHCFASHLLSGGADLRVVQELLGHVDVATTQVYTHVDRERLRGIHARFHPRQ
jgi:integrase/recombinase XerD